MPFTPTQTGQHQGIADASTMAQKPGFRGDALAIIVAIAACDSGGGGSIPGWNQAQYNAAWLQSKGGKDFSSFPCAQCSDRSKPNNGICSDGSAVPYAKYLNSIAHGGIGSAISGGLQSLADTGQAQNQPNLNPFNVPGVQRIATGLFGGILLLIGLMMFVKQIAGVSITGVPGKVGKVLAL